MPDTRTMTALAERNRTEDEPVVVFDHVSLAFDDTVVLRDVSFTLRRGHTKIILGASGAGKSISLKLILGLLKPDSGEVWVNGQQVDQLSETELMKVRAVALKPSILLNDEPATGLDPITSDTIDEEIVKLRDLEEVSSILVTHQLRDAFFVATQEAVVQAGKINFVEAGPRKLEEAEFMMLKDGLILFEGTAGELRASTDPYIQAFLS